MSAVNVLSNCKGLNTKDHPSQLTGESGSYLYNAVNVNITDTGAVERRSGYTVIKDGYTNAHSLVGYRNQYVIYADGNCLYSYDIVGGEVTVLLETLTADKPICYTEVGDMLVYSNGIERGLIAIDDGTVACLDYFAFIADPAQTEREIVEMPTTDLIHYFSGSMYGAIAGENYIYCSEPYKINHYDKSGGYIAMPAGINWLQDVGTALIAGTDNGVYALVGTGLSDFKQVTVRPVKSILCSEFQTFSFAGGYAVPVQKKGVLTLCADGVFFIDDNLEVDDMTEKLAFNWCNITAGTFGKIDNNYIFSGVTP